MLGDAEAGTVAQVVLERGQDAGADPGPLRELGLGQTVGFPDSADAVLQHGTGTSRGPVCHISSSKSRIRLELRGAVAACCEEATQVDHSRGRLRGIRSGVKGPEDVRRY